jgi:hypothetical protein
MKQLVLLASLALATPALAHEGHHHELPALPQIKPDPKGPGAQELFDEKFLPHIHHQFDLCGARGSRFKACVSQDEDTKKLTITVPL